MHNEQEAKGQLVRVADGTLTEADARAMLERIRWPNGVHCTFSDCGGAEVYRIETKPRTYPSGRTVGARHLFKCKACRRQFSVTKGTIFEDSKIQLRTWIRVMYRMCSSKRGVPAFQIHREFGITNESAWFMCHRIRWAMRNGDFSPLSGTVEADETYVGGKARGPRGDKTRSQRMAEAYARKAPVFGMVERGGRVRAQSMPVVNQKNVQDTLTANIDLANARLITDEHPVYRGIEQLLPHGVIRHKSEHVRGEVHTQSIESFWSIFKRGLIGTYYHVDAAYLDQYLNEFSFRHNTRKIKDADRFASLLGHVEGRLDWYLEKDDSA